MLPAQFKNVKLGQQVTTIVTRWDENTCKFIMDFKHHLSFLIYSDEYRGLPIVMVMETVTSASRSLRSRSSLSSTSAMEQVREGEIISVV